MSKGIVTVAQNNHSTDYVKLAYLQALSAKLTQTHSEYAIITTSHEPIPDRYLTVFDHVIRSDTDWAKDEAWKMANEWKVHDLAPFDQVLKVDADMLFTGDLVNWWQLYDRYDYVPALSAFDYRGERISSDYYRKTFTSNALPNVYSGLTYFRRSHDVAELYRLAYVLYTEWKTLSIEHLDYNRPKHPSTDVVFAMATKLLGLGCGIDVTGFTHMKRYVQNVPTHLITDQWYKNLNYYFDDKLRLYVENILQRRPFHYHIKAFATDALIKRYEKALGI